MRLLDGLRGALRVSRGRVSLWPWLQMRERVHQQALEVWPIVGRSVIGRPIISPLAQGLQLLDGLRGALRVPRGRIVMRFWVQMRERVHQQAFKARPIIGGPVIGRPVIGLLSQGLRLHDGLRGALRVPRG